MIMFLGITSPQDDFLCFPKTDAISSEKNTGFPYSGMARFWNIPILPPFRERYLPVAMFPPPLPHITPDPAEQLFQ
jgi:hypothetical protein